MITRNIIGSFLGNLLVAGIVIFVVLNMWVELTIEIETDKVANTQQRLQNRPQILFSREDCWQAMKHAEETQDTRDDDKEAIRICRHVAVWGDTDLQYKLGVLYRDGDGVVPDEEESRTWFESAARGGHIAAQYEVIRIYTDMASPSKNDSSSLIDMDTMEAYGWLCVLRKQMETPQPPGLDVWNDPRNGYSSAFATLSGDIDARIGKMVFPARWAARKLCRAYEKILPAGSLSTHQNEKLP